ncbi:magnesium transporter [Methanobacterium sp. ACI-7]|uniref:magnesium transporter n=1 Tax=Methanobacterium sp. ACI-7 TaxID=3240853 RepID=UPI0039C2F891
MEETKDSDLTQITKNVPVVQLGETVGYAVDLLSKKANKFDTIDYIYVVDKNNALRGVISIKTVIYADPEIKIEDLMDKDLITVLPHTSQRKVVYLALSNGLKAIPVVDEQKHFLGIFPYDDILHIFNQEYKKEIFSAGGISAKVGDEYTTIKSTAGVMIKSRLPWLILGVFGGTLAASVVSGFEEVLSKVLALAAFIPVLVYMSDAVGTQSEALIIRSIALEPKLPIRPYLIREFKIASALAIICGAIITLVAFIGWGNYVLGLIIGFSMFLSIIIAVLISTVLPLGFKKLHSDPAIATGPFATMISDIATLAIYFSVAILFLGYFRVI